MHPTNLESCLLPSCATRGSFLSETNPFPARLFCHSLDKKQERPQALQADILTDATLIDYFGHRIQLLLSHRSSSCPLFRSGCAALAAGAAATGAGAAGAAAPPPTFPTMDSGAYLVITSGGWILGHQTDALRILIADSDRRVQRLCMPQTPQFWGMTSLEKTKKKHDAAAKQHVELLSCIFARKGNDCQFATCHVQRFLSMQHLELFLQPTRCENKTPRCLGKEAH